MYRMAAYCRLSRDDGENRLSESIENQIAMIRDYVERSADLQLEDIYIDDGYSGLYFTNRPAFTEMMEDIYRGRIQGVITKDISRIGRDYIETGNYIERVFPSLGIRFISILDGVDSLLHSNEELAQLKTLLNDMYSRDISRKIRGALAAGKKKGNFMSGFAPYGYRKDPCDRHHFLVDETAAGVVRKIYAMYLSGCTGKEIAETLNMEKIPIPSEYKRKVQGLKYSNAREGAGEKRWNYPTVYAILKNPVYTGTMIQHKSEKISYKMEKCRRVPEQERFVVENTHQAIIGKTDFEKVQLKMQKKRKKRAD